MPCDAVGATASTEMPDAPAGVDTPSRTPSHGCRKATNVVTRQLPSDLREKSVDELRGDIEPGLFSDFDKTGGTGDVDLCKAVADDVDTH